MAVNGVEIKINDSKNFAKLSQVEKGLFEAFRDAMLLIFPTNEDGKSFSDETIEYVEKSAFEFVNKVPDAIKNPPTIESIMLAIAPLIASAAAPTAGGVTTK